MADTAKRRRTFTRDAAILLHVAAHKSDPFAAKRVALQMKTQKDIDHVGKEASVIVNLRKHEQNVFCAFFNGEGREAHEVIKALHPVKKRKPYVRKRAVRTELAVAA